MRTTTKTQSVGFPTLHSPLSTLHCKRSAFTLVELLAVVAIIGILAGMSTLALNSATQAAKEAKTRGTILKLDTAMQLIFEEYEEKFEALEKVRNVADGSLVTISSGFAGRQADRAKLHFIRDMMRMEMPTTWEEAIDSAAADDAPKAKPIPLGTFQVDVPGVSEFYWRARYNATAKHTDLTKINDELASAELLYLIIMNLNPEAFESFNESEIGDYDGNGLYEFHDAWGNPIKFLRWAPAWMGTDKQPDVMTLGGAATKDDWKSPYDADADPDSELGKAMTAANNNFHDPFDSNASDIAWFLYPVIFSAGQDKEFDVYMGPDSPVAPSVTTSPMLPHILYPFAAPLGAPVTGEGYFDNIHNHRMSGGF